MNRMWMRMACAVCAAYAAALLLAAAAMAETYHTVRALGAQALAGWHESYAAHGRVVDVDLEIRFPAVDAMPLLKVAERVEGHYYAVPSWTLNCLYVQNPEEELPEYGVEGATADRNSLEYATLVFDAQTGEMLDFTSREKDRAHYRGVVTRDDIGK